MPCLNYKETPFINILDPFCDDTIYHNEYDIYLWTHCNITSIYSVLTIHIRLCEKYFKGVILHIMAMHNLPWGLGLRFIARKNFYLNKFRTHRFRSQTL